MAVQSAILVVVVVAAGAGESAEEEGTTAQASTHKLGPGVKDRPPASNLHNHCKLVTPRERAPAHKTLRDLRWLHFPNTGTNFCTCLAHYACPRLPPRAHPSREQSPHERYVEHFVKSRLNSTVCDGDVTIRHPFGHDPLEEWEQEVGNIVAMFRDPRHRDYSAWRSRSPASRPQDVLTYVQQHHSCQTRMVLGLPCTDPSQLTAEITLADLAYARSLLRKKFAFIGLSEFWRESVCLFHAMFGGDITPVELRPMRHGASGSLQTPAHIDTFANAADWALYLDAAALFAQRLRQHGIAVPSALNLLVPSSSSSSSSSP